MLAFVFLMPAEQTWYETRQRSKVILLWDVSHPAEIVCQLGVNPLSGRVVRGRTRDA